MPGRYEHVVELNVNNGGIVRIDLPPPCESIAAEVNGDIANMVGKVEGGAGGLMSEIASLSRNMQISALDSYGSNKSGTLAGSITEEVSGNSARIGTDLFYAQFLHDGRGSVTASGNVLHFFNDGEEVFVKSVGPSTPRPYLDDSAKMMEVQIDAIVNHFLESVG